MSTASAFPVSSSAITGARLPAAATSPPSIQQSQHARPARTSFGSFLIGTVSCAVIALAFIMFVDEGQHWFVIPVFICGVLITADAVDWLRGRMDLFDPVGLIGLFGFHFFFLAPLLQVAYDVWPPWIPDLPSDWRPWLGRMAILNALGLLVYRLTRNFFTGRDVFEKRRAAKRATVIWVLDPNRAMNLLAIGLVAALTLQVYTYARMGGIAGYVRGLQSGHKQTADFLEPSAQIAGASVISYVTGLSESFPIFAMMGFAIYFARRRRLPLVSTVLLALAIFFALKLLFGGLRGSRSNTLLGLLWAVGIVHFWVRPMTKKLIFSGLAFVILFIYMYGFFKVHGLDTLAAIRRAGSIAQLEADSRRSLQGTLLGDLARSDLHALILYRLQDKNWDYELAWGRSYYAAAVSVVPYFLWPDRPPGKQKEATDLLYGRGSYAGGLGASQAFGLAGEAMFNFGPYAVPLAFLLPGFLVGRLRRALYKWKEGPTIDARYLMFPFLITLAISLFIGDLGNIVFGLFKNGTFPFLILLFSCRRRVLSPITDGGVPVQRIAPPATREKVEARIAAGG